MVPGPVKGSQEPEAIRRKNVAVPSIGTPGHKSVLEGYMTAVTKKDPNILGLENSAADKKEPLKGSLSIEADADAKTDDPEVSKTSKPEAKPERKADRSSIKAVPGHKAALSGYMAAIQAKKTAAEQAIGKAASKNEVTTNATTASQPEHTTDPKSGTRKLVSSPKPVKKGQPAALTGYMAAIQAKKEASPPVVAPPKEPAKKPPPKKSIKADEKGVSSGTPKAVPGHKAALSGYMAAIQKTAIEPVPIKSKMADEVSKDEAVKEKTEAKQLTSMRGTSKPVVPGHKAVLTGYMSAINAKKNAVEITKPVSKSGSATSLSTQSSSSKDKPNAAVKADVVASTPGSKEQAPVPGHKAALTGYIAAISAKKGGPSVPEPSISQTNAAETPLKAKSTDGSRVKKDNGSKPVLSGYMAAVNARKKVETGLVAEINPATKSTKVVAAKTDISKSFKVEEPDTSTGTKKLSGHKTKLTGYLSAVATNQDAVPIPAVKEKPKSVGKINSPVFKSAVKDSGPPNHPESKKDSSKASRVKEVALSRDTTSIRRGTEQAHEPEATVVSVAYLDNEDSVMAIEQTETVRDSPSKAEQNNTAEIEVTTESDTTNGTVGEPVSCDQVSDMKSELATDPASCDDRTSTSPKHQFDAKRDFSCAGEDADKVDPESSQNAESESPIAESCKDEHEAGNYEEPSQNAESASPIAESCEDEHKVSGGKEDEASEPVETDIGPIVSYNADPSDTDEKSSSPHEGSSSELKKTVEDSTKEGGKSSVGHDEVTVQSVYVHDATPEAVSFAVEELGPLDKHEGSASTNETLVDAELDCGPASTNETLVDAELDCGVSDREKDDSSHFEAHIVDTPNDESIGHTLADGPAIVEPVPMGTPATEPSESAEPGENYTESIPSDDMKELVSEQNTENYVGEEPTRLDGKDSDRAENEKEAGSPEVTPEEGSGDPKTTKKKKKGFLGGLFGRKKEATKKQSLNSELVTTSETDGEPGVVSEAHGKNKPSDVSEDYEKSPKDPPQSTLNDTGETANGTADEPELPADLVGDQECEESIPSDLAVGGSETKQSEKSSTFFGRIRGKASSAEDLENIEEGEIAGAADIAPSSEDLQDTPRSQIGLSADTTAGQVIQTDEASEKETAGLCINEPANTDVTGKESQGDLSDHSRNEETAEKEDLAICARSINDGEGEAQTIENKAKKTGFFGRLLSRGSSMDSGPSSQKDDEDLSVTGKEKVVAEGESFEGESRPTGMFEESTEESNDCNAQAESSFETQNGRLPDKQLEAAEEVLAVDSDEVSSNEQEWQAEKGKKSGMFGKLFRKGASKTKAEEIKKDVSDDDDEKTSAPLSTTLGKFVVEIEPSEQFEPPEACNAEAIVEPPIGDQTAALLSNVPDADSVERKEDCSEQSENKDKKAGVFGKLIRGGKASKKKAEKEVKIEAEATEAKASSNPGNIGVFVVESPQEKSPSTVLDQHLAVVEKDGLEKSPANLDGNIEKNLADPTSNLVDNTSATSENKEKKPGILGRLVRGGTKSSKQKPNAKGSIEASEDERKDESQNELGVFVVETPNAMVQSETSNEKEPSLPSNDPSENEQENRVVDRMDSASVSQSVSSTGEGSAQTPKKKKKGMFGRLRRGGKSPKKKSLDGEFASERSDEDVSMSISMSRSSEDIVERAAGPGLENDSRNSLDEIPSEDPQVPGVVEEGDKTPKDASENGGDDTVRPEKKKKPGIFGRLMRGGKASKEKTVEEERTNERSDEGVSRSTAKISEPTNESASVVSDEDQEPEFDAFNANEESQSHENEEKELLKAAQSPPVSISSEPFSNKSEEHSPVSNGPATVLDNVGQKEERARAETDTQEQTDLSELLNNEENQGSAKPEGEFQKKKVFKKEAVDDVAEGSDSSSASESVATEASEEGLAKMPDSVAVSPNKGLELPSRDSSSAPEVVKGIEADIIDVSKKEALDGADEKSSSSVGSISVATETSDKDEEAQGDIQPPDEGSESSSNDSASVMTEGSDTNVDQGKGQTTPADTPAKDEDDDHSESDSSVDSVSVATEISNKEEDTARDSVQRPDEESVSSSSDFVTEGSDAANAKEEKPKAVPADTTAKDDDDDHSESESTENSVSVATEIGNKKEDQAQDCVQPPDDESESSSNDSVSVATEDSGVDATVKEVHSVPADKSAKDYGDDQSESESSVDLPSVAKDTGNKADDKAQDGVRRPDFESESSSNDSESVTTEGSDDGANVKEEKVHTVPADSPAKDDDDYSESESSVNSVSVATDDDKTVPADSDNSDSSAEAQDLFQSMLRDLKGSDASNSSNDGSSVATEEDKKNSFDSGSSDEADIDAKEAERKKASDDDSSVSSESASEPSDSEVEAVRKKIPVVDDSSESASEPSDSEEVVKPAKKKAVIKKRPAVKKKPIIDDSSSVSSSSASEASDSEEDAKPTKKRVVVKKKKVVAKKKKPIDDDSSVSSESASEPSDSEEEVKPKKKKKVVVKKKKAAAKKKKAAGTKKTKKKSAL